MNPQQTRPGEVAQPAEPTQEEGRSAWANPAAPEEPDSDRAGGSGNKDLASDDPKPATGADASSHGSR